MDSVTFYNSARLYINYLWHLKSSPAIQHVAFRNSPFLHFQQPLALVGSVCGVVFILIPTQLGNLTCPHLQVIWAQTFLT